MLEPMAFAPAQVYQKALCDADIPATAFTTKDIDVEFQKVKASSRLCPVLLFSPSLNQM